MAARHALLTAVSWTLWLAVVALGAHLIAPRAPQIGDLLGIAGTLLMFAPTASLFAWDVLTRGGRPPRDAQGEPLRSSHGYETFSWAKVWSNTVGITLIGLGFGVSYLAPVP